MSRATCSLKPDVWSSLLVDYVPSDSCYTSEVLVAGMKYGSYTRYEGARTVSLSKRSHPDARKHPHELLQLVLQELSLGRVIAPFSVVRLSPRQLTYSIRLNYIYYKVR